MLLPNKQYHVRLDTDTGQYMVCAGSAVGDYTVIGPLVKSAIIQDEAGNQADVSADGGLHVIERGGLPFFWTDAAANADDSYYDLGVVPRDCTYASLYVETNDAIVSFNGGLTDHHFVDVDAGQFFLAGLDIPAGSTISGKNAVAAADYDNLRVAVW